MKEAKRLTFRIKDALLEHPCTESVKVWGNSNGHSNNSEHDLNKIYLLRCKYMGDIWKLLIIVPEDFPYSLPAIFLEDCENYKPMGHVEWNGLICYKDSQGLVIDRRKSKEVLHGCLYEALSTLHENSSDEHRFELQMEFEAYWESSSKKRVKTWCLVEPSDKIKEIKSFRHKFSKKSKNKKSKQDKIKNPDEWTAIVDSDHENLDYHPIKSLIENKHSYSAIYIPLAVPIDLPSFKSNLIHSDFITKIKKAVNDDIWINALAWARKQKWRSNHLLVFSHPKPDGTSAMWCVEFSRSDTAIHPLISTNTNWKTEAVPIRRHSRDYLLIRGGSTDTLINKKILIIGCGSVGGTIAFQLARSGIGEIDLADPDVFEAENLYRHVLGASMLFEESYNKALQLAFLLRRDIPYLKSQFFRKRLLQFLENKEVLSRYDLIIVATGSFTHELVFNEKLREFADVPSTIYAWQDGFGVGGHAIRVNNIQHGCLECLYTTLNGRMLHPKTSFIKQGQTISKHLGGCSGVFTPYSFNDATQTAILASQLAIDCLNGDSSPMMRSWRGNDKLLVENGFEASNWFYRWTDNDAVDNSNFISKECLICG